jgi:DNA recombination protein RmuC
MTAILIAAMLIVLILEALAIFYLVIRSKDVARIIGAISERMPLSDEMRRQASETIASLNERMGALNQKAGQIGEVMKEVATLRNLFIMPKGAGGAGERLLEKALHDILTENMYGVQHRLSSGTVDVVIKFRENLVPIDSKLSLEDFKKMLSAQDEAEKKGHWRAFAAAVKKRIDETARYILPGERTTDFALMYIASEAAYYEAFVKATQFNEENPLFEYALKRNVYPTSPQTIYPYLVTILQGMKALKIEENAKEILGKVSGLRNDFERFRSIYKTIIDHLTNARKKHDNEAQSAITKLEQHISSLEQKSV